ncbi:hypothetical protein CHS0354_032452 [Potamilus streckersoni]|uniref:PBZ-type domain-containing protein n=1 Tax=Potamilus streckersoni TaxID=2493646 RepID=A0AAE0SPS8_9BIVA|nr:hypothetical protein CHS0354_032452 [Potamilus streckersoni]
MASAHTVSDSDSDKTTEPDSHDTLKPSTRNLYNNSPDLFDNTLPSTPVKRRVPSVTRQRGKVHEISESDSDDSDQSASHVSGKSLSSMTKSLDTSFSKRQEFKEKTKHENMTIVQSDHSQKKGRSSSASKYEREKSTSIGQQLESRQDKSSGDTGSKDGNKALSRTNQNENCDAESTKSGLKRKATDSKKESQTTLQKHETVRLENTNNNMPQDSRPLCKYDAICYRKNPTHFQEYRHPEKEKGHTSSATEPPPNKKLKKESEAMVGSSLTQTTISKSRGVSELYKHAQPFSFFLTKVAGIADKYNSTLALDIKDILSADMGNLVASCQFNYMFDIPWLIQQYPKEFRSKPLLIVHGEQGPSKTELEAEAIDYKNIRFCQAKLEMMYGTHHTKMMLLQYDTGMRVVIHTSNLIKQDWHQKTQGIWISPLFPKMAKPSATEGDSLTYFKKNLLEYVSAYKAYQLKDWINNISEHDMSAARVVIIGSVPGRHTGDQMRSWGHLKLKRVLQQHGPSNTAVTKWPVIGQFSSVGSMGANKEAWLCGEWLQSLSAVNGGTTLPSVPPLQLVFPTKDNVRCSLEGFPAGGSIPYSINVAKKQMFLHDFFHQWRSEGQGRSRAMPHIKTYLRPSPDSQKTAWFLVTSANLSKAAWGALEKKGTQLMIRSYEIGVLFLPKFFGDKELFDVSSNLELLKSSTNVFPLPFDLPLTDYVKGKDRPWLWDIPYMDLPDTNGNIWCPRAR